MVAAAASTLDRNSDAPISARSEDEPAAPAPEPFAPSASELLSLIGDSVVSTDDRGRIILFNKAAEELFGYPAVEVLGRRVEMLLPAGAGAAHRQAVAAFAASSGAGTRMMGQRREVAGRRASGEEFPAEATLSRQEVGGRAVLTVVVRDITAQRQAEEQRTILSRELAHRFKNMMAVVASILSLTARHAATKEALVASLRGRLASLARTHDLLLGGEAEGGDLQRLLEGELAPYWIHSSTNVRLSGEPCRLAARQALDVGLAVHELATNAAKYGALSSATGRVEVSWTVDEDILDLHWTESGGPATRAPLGVGFGTELIQRLLGGGVGVDYRSEGLEARMRVPLGR